MSPGRLQRRLHRLEDGLLATAVLAMVALAGLQIGLRLFGGGMSWIEPALRALVLWIGMLGAITASRSGRHIRIDVLTRAVAPHWRQRLQVLGYAFTTGVCALIAYHAARFVALELEFPTAAFAGIPSWVVVLILPAAFALIGLRYALAAIDLVRGREPFPDEPPC